jgi:hypothetical protein
MGSNYRKKKERINISASTNCSYSYCFENKTLKTYCNNAVNIEFTPINTIAICRLAPAVNDIF